ncbi:unnamed protein product [Prorocentrum cordatum]|uniref:Uncharacterized protein n=1 Tax=Prorocentrum cordatum TaxID=2364126 RepID=A0ABN9VKZ4_9DINO|nr:unnamed protein product [Polarella glacialis]
MDGRPAVGERVLVRASGRFAAVLADDGSEVPFKVQFEDGELPVADWIGLQDLDRWDAPAAEVRADLPEVTEAVGMLRSPALSIAEYFGPTASGDAKLSACAAEVTAATGRLRQVPEYDQYVLVTSGEVQLLCDEQTISVPAGHGALLRAGREVAWSWAQPCQYVSVCLLGPDCLSLRTAGTAGQAQGGAVAPRAAAEATPRRKRRGAKAAPGVPERRRVEGAPRAPDPQRAKLDGEAEAARCENAACCEEHQAAPQEADESSLEARRRLEATVAALSGQAAASQARVAALEGELFAKTARLEHELSLHAAAAAESRALAAALEAELGARAPTEQVLKTECEALRVEVASLRQEQREGAEREKGFRAKVTALELEHCERMAAACRVQERERLEEERAHAAEVEALKAGLAASEAELAKAREALASHARPGVHSDLALGPQQEGCSASLGRSPAPSTAASELASEGQARRHPHLVGTSKIALKPSSLSVSDRASDQDHESTTEGPLTRLTTEASSIHGSPHSDYCYSIPDCTPPGRRAPITNTPDMLRGSSMSCFEQTVDTDGLVELRDRMDEIRQEELFEERPVRYGARHLNTPVVVVSSEMHPWSKTGGLAMVVGSYAYEFAMRGHRTMAIAPRYGDYEGTEIVGSAEVWLDGREHQVKYYHLRKDYGGGNGCDYVFVDHPSYHRSAGIYGDPKHGGEYQDNLFRFALLSAAALEAPLLLNLGGSTYGQEICFIANDWQTGLLPLYLNYKYKPNSTYRKARVMMVLHNMGYQGRYRKSTYPVDRFLGLPKEAERELSCDRDCLNLLGAGIQVADRVLTVSPNYARQIQTAAGGLGLDHALREKSGLQRFEGILNGISDEWSPMIDPLTCLIGFCGRLCNQKGIHLINEVIPWLLTDTGNSVNGRAQLIMMGKGDTGYEQMIRTAEAHFKGRVCGYIGFDPEVEHRMMAGCDILLMPSQYEPCGLPQMYAQQYGTLPVVHETGGLKDSVHGLYDESRDRQRATGFLFSGFDANRLKERLYQALSIFHHKKDLFRQMQSNAMGSNFYWPRAIDEYEKCIDATMEAPPLRCASRAHVRAPSVAGPQTLRSSFLLVARCRQGAVQARQAHARSTEPSIATPPPDQQSRQARWRAQGSGLHGTMIIARAGDLSVLREVNAHVANSPDLTQLQRREKYGIDAAGVLEYFEAPEHAAEAQPSPNKEETELTKHFSAVRGSQPERMHLVVDVAASAVDTQLDAIMTADQSVHARHVAPKSDIAIENGTDNGNMMTKMTHLPIQVPTGAIKLATHHALEGRLLPLLPHPRRRAGSIEAITASFHDEPSPHAGSTMAAFRRSTAETVANSFQAPGSSNRRIAATDVEVAGTPRKVAASESEQERRRGTTDHIHRTLAPAEVAIPASTWLQDKTSTVHLAMQSSLLAPQSSLQVNKQRDLIYQVLHDRPYPALQLVDRLRRSTSSPIAARVRFAERSRPVAFILEADYASLSFKPYEQKGRITLDGPPIAKLESSTTAETDTKIDWSCILAARKSIRRDPVHRRAHDFFSEELGEATHQEQAIIDTLDLPAGLQPRPVPDRRVLLGPAAPRSSSAIASRGFNASAGRGLPPCIFAAFGGLNTNDEPVVSFAEPQPLAPASIGGDQHRRLSVHAAPEPAIAIAQPTAEDTQAIWRQDLALAYTLQSTTTIGQETLHTDGNTVSLVDEEVDANALGDYVSQFALPNITTPILNIPSTKASSLRPISRKNSDSEIFASALNQQLKAQVERHAYPIQQGFIRGHKFCNNILLTDTLGRLAGWRPSVNVEKPILVSFDIAAAFPSLGRAMDIGIRTIAQMLLTDAARACADDRGIHLQKRPLLITLTTTIQQAELLGNLSFNVKTCAPIPPWVELAGSVSAEVSGFPHRCLPDRVASKAVAIGPSPATVDANVRLYETSATTVLGHLAQRAARDAEQDGIKPMPQRHLISAQVANWTPDNFEVTLMKRLGALFGHGSAPHVDSRKFGSVCARDSISHDLQCDRPRHLTRLPRTFAKNSMLDRIGFGSHYP